MTITALGPCGDASGFVQHEVILTLVSIRPMMFQNSKVEMHDRVGVLEPAVDDAVDHGSPLEWARM